MKISIITVTYNSTTTIEDTIKSVCDKPIMILNILLWMEAVLMARWILFVNIVVFSGKLNWISEKDHGIYDAMNKGVHGYGDVVGILNSDDFFASDTVIERLVKRI